MAVHDCGQFEKFLSVVVEQLDLPEKIVTETWQACKEKAKLENMEGERLMLSGLEFLHEISSHQKEAAYKLRSILSIFDQCTYVGPTSGITDSLSELQCDENTYNRTIKLVFRSPSEIKVVVSNPIRFLRKNRHFIELVVKNSLCTDLSDTASWSSTIAVQTNLSEDVGKESVKKYVINPLKAIGIEV
ncbi:MAG: hypothetical protein JSR46_11495 [Verrucomicrobia bacterium]|nr:hypothetical protein [Verrucomicrobiota bacterium]